MHQIYVINKFEVIFGRKRNSGGFLKKSKLNTLVVSGGWGGSGDIHFRGYADNFPEINRKSHF